MEKIKKLLTIYLTLFIALTNFSVVFAEENEEIKNNEIEEQETIEEQEQEQQEIIVNYENQEQLNNIQNDINDINNSLNEIKPKLFSNYVNGDNGILTNFNLLSPKQLIYYYDNYNDITVFNLINNNNQKNVYVCNNVINVDYTYNDSNGLLRIVTKSISRDLLDTNTNVLQTTNGFFVLHTDTISDEGLYPFYKIIFNDINYNNYSYELKPFKLNIINNGLGEIINSVNIEPYVSTNIYYDGQQITLTYDNSNDDFNGWYKNGNYVSNNLSYTFNIDTDTNIELNKYIEPIESDTYTMILSCIFICLLFITFKSLIWGV